MINIPPGLPGSRSTRPESLRFLPPPTSDSAPNVATRAPDHLLISRASAAMSQVTFRCQLPWRRKGKHPSVINNQLGYIAASARSLLTTSVGWYRPGLAFMCGPTPNERGATLSKCGKCSARTRTCADLFGHLLYVQSDESLTCTATDKILQSDGMCDPNERPVTG